MYLMEHLNELKPQAVFSHRRRTAAILIGDGTAVAYMAGVMKALKDAGIRIDNANNEAEKNICICSTFE